MLAHMARSHPSRRAAAHKGSKSLSSVIGLSLAASLYFPRAHAALSISSGYESFLVDIRQRIVCEEGDVVDKALERGTAEPCDSVTDGPFCRGLPEQLAMPRHRPYTVDSIVPQHLFSRGAEENAKRTPDGTQATRVLNEFLLRFYSPREASLEGVSKMMVLEGFLNIEESALRLGTLPWPQTYSRGLPQGIMASWAGSWQLTHGPLLDWSSFAGRSVASQKSRKTVAAVRLNSVLGTIRFSRPVVVRHLLLHPPDHSLGPSVLEVRGRIRGKEQWRHAYEFAPERAASHRPICEIGDLLNVFVPDDGEYMLGILLSSQRAGASVQLLGDERSHSFVEWRYLRTFSGHDCMRNLGQQPQEGKSSLWRDLARRLKAVDEIALASPSGSSGWLLGTFVVSSARAVLDLEGDHGVDQGQDPKDLVYHVVQVFPGPRAVISEVSRASVLYDADDMLQRGLGIRQQLPNIAPRSLESSPDAVEGSGPKQLVTHRSVESVRQLFLSLAGDSAGERARLPPHITSMQFLTDASRLLSSLYPAKADVKRHHHYEAFFAAHADVLTPADALLTTFERWIRSPSFENESQVVAQSFQPGQRWDGSYFCTQGETVLSLKIEDVKDFEGHIALVAEMTFQLLDINGKEVQGSYTVTGTLESLGRVLVLDPVDGSWKDQPGNFVMVGLHGVVSRTPLGQLTYAGSIPIFGCDSFELFAQTGNSTNGVGDHPSATQAVDPAPHGESDAISSTVPAVEGRPPSPSWRVALRTLVQSLDESRRRWRLLLAQIIQQTNQEKKKGSTVAVGVHQIKEAIEGAMKGAVLSFEFSTADGEKYVVKVGEN